MAEINNPENKLKCEVCQKDLTFSTNYYKCTECIPDFFWCSSCFLKTEKNTAEDFGEEGKQLSTTKAWHIHKLTIVKIDIYTPSKKKYEFE